MIYPLTNTYQCHPNSNKKPKPKNNWPKKITAAPNWLAYSQLIKDDTLWNILNIINEVNADFPGVCVSTVSLNWVTVYFNKNTQFGSDALFGTLAPFTNGCSSATGYYA